MSKQAGLGDRLWVGGYNLSGDMASIDDVSSPRGVLPATDITMSAMARMHGLKDGAMGFTAYFNKASNQAHPRLSALPTSDVVCTYGRGTTLGNVAACLVAKQIDYNPSRPADGSLLFKTSMQANGYGLEWGRQLTAGERTDTAATNGTGVDFVAATAFGLQAYLQVLSFTGATLTVKLQESSDNGVGDAFADVVGGGFTANPTARSTERISTTRTLAVERYLRVVTTGTFSECTFVVVVVKNEASELF